MLSLFLDLTVRKDAESECMLCRVRTSSGMFLNRAEDEIIDRIESRIAKYTAIPKENGEGLQILHYQV